MADRIAAPSEKAFAADPTAVFAFVDCFFEALAAGGVEHVVVSPGSRSTPLAIAADRTREIRTWIELDERSAGFFALGLAKTSRRPVALVCTSGTAAANYLPAVVESHYSRVPLILLTADRPPELRDWGAGQTIEQHGLYGRYPRWVVEVPVPEAGPDAERYARRLAARSIDAAASRPAGSVHLNWPLREPLEPPATIVAGPLSAQPIQPTADDPGLRFSRAEEVAAQQDVEALVEQVRGSERGVICAGPMDADAEMVEAIAAFAAASGWPVLADPASQLRSSGADAPILSAGDAVTRASGFTSRMRPEMVLRLGETPVSKAQRLWLEAAEPSEIWWLDDGGHWGEPSHRATRVIRGGVASLLSAAAHGLSGHAGRSSAWCRAFEAAESAARRAFDDFVAGADGLSGLALASRIAAALPAKGRLFSSNSMAIRLLDLGFANRPDPIRVLVSRGASGIDGITSTALGVAATSASGQRTMLWTGDLAFLHDLGGLLLARHERIDLTIVVLDDDGGGIFSFLPVAQQGEAVHFDRLFKTPHGLDLARAAALFELDYTRVETGAELENAIDVAFGREGVSILHVPVDAKRNEACFREAVACMVEAVEGVAGVGA